MSNDLISREKARDEILLLMKDMKFIVGDDTLWEGVTISPTEVANTMRKVPSADAVEVVRCKDCKHRDPEDKKCDSGHFIQWQLPRDDDWFCADGERKEE